MGGLDNWRLGEDNMELRRDLGLIHVFCIAAGSMIGAELFILPGLIHAQVGPAAILCFFLAGLLAATGMLSTAELASAMPKAGGDYFFVNRGLGPSAGTVAGFLSWFSLSMKSALALMGMAIFIVPYFRLNIRLLSIILCLFFIVINLIGIKEAGWLQVWLVFGLLSLMLLYLIWGFPAIEVSHYVPFAPKGFSAIFSAAGFVFLSYGGLLKVVSVAEEIKDPGRVIPLGMIISLLVVTAFYVLMVFVTIGILGPESLNVSLIPLSDGAVITMGQWGKAAMSLAAILACVTTANAGIMSASRYLLALSRDRLLPDFFGRVNARFNTPHLAILVTGGLVIMALFLNLNALVEAGSAILILTYILANLAIIFLREGHLQNYQPTFRVPLYPWIQIGGIIGLFFLLLEMGLMALAITTLLMAIGFAFFFLYGRLRSRRESALLHILERITAKDFAGGSLESELKEIIRERDNIIQDRFDQIIEKSLVLDLEKAISLDDFFTLASQTLAKQLGVHSLNIFQLLQEREKESSTVIGPGLAIPHIIIEGEQQFEILLVRCREGILFPGSILRINAILVLAGTRDERNFYLRALSAIAQIASDPHFEKKWMAAKGKEALRDIILLGDRKRFD